MKQETKDKIGACTTTHGATRQAADPLAWKAYRSWQHMRARCSDPRNNRYNQYGARGIRVCSAWERFEEFLRDMGTPPTLRHSIDRLNPDGNYERSNCRWATPSEQAATKRNTIRVTVDGHSKTLAALSLEIGIDRRTLWLRLRKGWTPDELLKPAYYRRAQL